MSKFTLSKVGKALKIEKNLQKYILNLIEKQLLL